MTSFLAPLVLANTNTSAKMLDQNFATATEVLARAAVANCASHLVLPRLPAAVARMGVAYDLGRMPRILQQRTKIVDQSDRVWTAVRNYFAPIAVAVNNGRDGIVVDRVAWRLYLLVLASRSASELYLDVADTVAFIDHLVTSLSSTAHDAQARLAFVRGTFATFQQREEMPGLTILAGDSLAFRERIEEILEDAYLAEAASLRQFLSFEANRAAIRRDLRRLLKWVVRHRPWAKGALQVAEHSAALPSKIGASALTSLTDALGVANKHGPVVLHGYRRPWEAWFPDGPQQYRWHEVFRPVQGEIDAKGGEGRLIEDTYIVTHE